LDKGDQLFWRRGYASDHIDDFGFLQFVSILPQLSEFVLQLLDAFFSFLDLLIDLLNFGVHLVPP
jgi:hypothetical protein